MKSSIAAIDAVTIKANPTKPNNLLQCPCLNKQIEDYTVLPVISTSILGAQ
jgi:hypothetical protein